MRFTYWNKNRTTSISLNEKEMGELGAGFLSLLFLPILFYLAWPIIVPPFYIFDYLNHLGIHSFVCTVSAIIPPILIILALRYFKIARAVYCVSETLFAASYLFFEFEFDVVWRSFFSIVILVTGGVFTYALATEDIEF